MSLGIHIVNGSPVNPSGQVHIGEGVSPITRHSEFDPQGEGLQRSFSTSLAKGNSILRSQVTNGLPVNPGKQLQNGLWLTTEHWVFRPHAPGQGSIHFCFIQAIFEGHSWFPVHSGRHNGGEDIPEISYIPGGIMEGFLHIQANKNKLVVHSFRDILNLDRKETAGMGSGILLLLRGVCDLKLHKRHSGHMFRGKGLDILYSDKLSCWRNQRPISILDDSLRKGFRNIPESTSRNAYFPAYSDCIWQTDRQYSHFGMCIWEDNPNLKSIQVGNLEGFR
uniref:Uncharacterized protein n=1 Tax=Glossina pallidipes TaxID=7398 RepID=A0A1A9ZCQ8_GLOPL